MKERPVESREPTSTYPYSITAQAHSSRRNLAFLIRLKPSTTIWRATNRSIHARPYRYRSSRRMSFGSPRTHQRSNAVDRREPRQFGDKLLSSIGSTKRRWHGCAAGPRRRDRGRCDRRRRQRCVLTLQSDRLRPCEAERLAILAVNGPAAIEFRCGGTPRDGGSGQTGRESGECRFSGKKYKWPTNP
jgi:hypothetical protein